MEGKSENINVVTAPFCMVYLIGNSHLAAYRGVGKNLVEYLHPNVIIENLAVGGAKMDFKFLSSLAVMEVREKEYPTKNTSFAFVMIGDNDLRSGTPASQLVRELVAALTRSTQRNPHLIIFLCGLIDSPSLKTKKVREFNDQLRQECESMLLEHNGSLIYLDLNELILRASIEEEVPKVLIFNKDKVHLGIRGEKLVCRVFASVLNPRLHGIFNNEAPKILDKVKARMREPEYSDYLRMKGIFRKDYSDMIKKDFYVRPLQMREVVEGFYEKPELKVGGVFSSPYCSYKTVKVNKREREPRTTESESERTAKLLRIVNNAMERSFGHLGTS